MVRLSLIASTKDQKPCDFALHDVSTYTQSPDISTFLNYEIFKGPVRPNPCTSDAALHTLQPSHTF